ncbi:MAG: hypothetical protein HY302_02310 [Opitutae bacterium]|nr:hypothetical protein [Opitutae bacterium]
MSTSPSQAVYFDSNVLRKANWPSPSARLLEIIGKAAGAKVEPVLVDLVQRELVEGWIRDMIRNRVTLLEKTREYARRSAGLVEIADAPRLPPAEEMRKHVIATTEKFTSLFRLVPTSKQPAEYYMDLAVSRGGAFVEGGRGFNDTVISTSIIEDMTAHSLTGAILVSEDPGFQNDGMKRVTGDKRLQIARNLDELDKILDKLTTDRVHAYIREKKERLLAAVRAHGAELVPFLKQRIPLMLEELTVVDRVRKAELVEILDFKEAHGLLYALGQEPEENRISVEVQVRIRVETETVLFEQRRQRLDGSPFVLHPEDTMISSSDQDVALTVEGSATGKDEDIQNIVFESVRIKTTARALGDFLGLLRS